MQTDYDRKYLRLLALKKKNQERYARDMEGVRDTGAIVPNGMVEAPTLTLQDNETPEVAYESLSRKLTKKLHDAEKTEYILQRLENDELTLFNSTFDTTIRSIENITSGPVTKNEFLHLLKKKLNTDLTNVKPSGNEAAPKQPEYSVTEMAKQKMKEDELKSEEMLRKAEEMRQKDIQDEMDEKDDIDYEVRVQNAINSHVQKGIELLNTIAYYSSKVGNTFDSNFVIRATKQVQILNQQIRDYNITGTKYDAELKKLTDEVNKIIDKKPEKFIDIKISNASLQEGELFLKLLTNTKKEGYGVDETRLSALIDDVNKLLEDYSSGFISDAVYVAELAKAKKAGNLLIDESETQYSHIVDGNLNRYGYDGKNKDLKALAKKIEDKDEKYTYFQRYNYMLQFDEIANAIDVKVKKRQDVQLAKQLAEEEKERARMQAEREIEALLAQREVENEKLKKTLKDIKESKKSLGTSDNIFNEHKRKTLDAEQKKAKMENDKAMVEINQKIEEIKRDYAASIVQGEAEVAEKAEEAAEAAMEAEVDDGGVAAGNALKTSIATVLRYLKENPHDPVVENWKVNHKGLLTKNGTPYAPIANQGGSSSHLLSKFTSGALSQEDQDAFFAFEREIKTRINATPTKTGSKSGSRKNTPSPKKKPFGTPEKKGNGVKRGRGLKKPGTHKVYGKYYLDSERFRRNELSLKYVKNQNNVPTFKPVRISMAAKRVIEGVLTNAFDENAYAALSDTERYTIRTLAGLLGFDCLKNYNSENEEFQNRLEVLLGEVQAGNNSKVLLRDLKKFILKGIQTGKMSKASGYELLLELGFQS